MLVTANPGCLMQVTSAIERSGHPMGMAHTVEVLDASIRGAPASTLAARLTHPPIHPREISMFQQDLQPVGDSLFLSALCGAIPLLTLFVLLGGLRSRPGWPG